MEHYFQQLITKIKSQNKKKNNRIKKLVELFIIILYFGISIVISFMINKRYEYSISNLFWWILLFILIISLSLIRNKRGSRYFGIFGLVFFLIVLLLILFIPKFYYFIYSIFN